MIDHKPWPMDVPDWSLVFHPKGYLIAILADPDEGERALATVEAAGYAPEDVRVYSGEEILDNHERCIASQSTVGKIVGAVTDDAEGRDAYLAYARDGRSALWMRIPDEYGVPKALRTLADHKALHIRYYGDKRQDDFHMA